MIVVEVLAHMSKDEPKSVSSILLRFPSGTGFPGLPGGTKRILTPENYSQLEIKIRKVGHLARLLAPKSLVDNRLGKPASRRFRLVYHKLLGCLSVISWGWRIARSQGELEVDS